MITVLRQSSFSGLIEYYDADTFKHHRPNGPALFWEDPVQRDYNVYVDWMWGLYGKLHRYYGPANDEGDWYLHGDNIK